MDTAAFPAVSDEKLLRALENAFARHAGGDDHIDPGKLKAALGLKSDYLARRIFSVFDRNADGLIDRDEFLSGVRALVFGNDRDKLYFAFRLHDHDGDGAISETEMFRMIAIALAESDVAEKATQPSERLARNLFTVVDADRDGKLSFAEFEAAVSKRPELLRRMTRSEALWIAPNEELAALLEDPRNASFKRKVTIKEGGFGPAVFVLLWALANVAAFAAACVLSDDASVPMRAGRAFGTTIDLDGALILVPVMRRLITKVRPTWFGRLVPVDHSVGFHRIVGHTLFGLSVAHGAAMTVAYLQGHPSSSVGRLFFYTERGLTGFALLSVFAVMWAFSLVRRSRHFELFYFTHLLYLVWFALLVAHAPGFLVAGTLPLAAFAVERISRARRRGAPTVVLETEVLRSGVTRLALRRPEGFRFSAGDYLFVRIPCVARMEWHPFTISSAPEDDDLVLHVRSLGNWTSALRRLAEAREATRASEPVEAFVDGPYGTPSARIFESRCVVLVAAGIGVTPFASVLDSLVRRANGRGAPTALEKAYFIWLNRDQYSFEWFRSLLGELEKTDMRGLLDVHLCMTGGHAGAAALGLELARDVMHGAGRSDIITGLRTHTHVGAPDFHELLGQIARRHRPEAVDVFFCGPHGLARALERISRELGMRFYEEQF